MRQLKMTLRDVRPQAKQAHQALSLQACRWRAGQARLQRLGYNLHLFVVAARPSTQSISSLLDWLSGRPDTRCPCIPSRVTCTRTFGCRPGPEPYNGSLRRRALPSGCICHLFPQRVQGVLVSPEHSRRFAIYSRSRSSWRFLMKLVRRFKSLAPEDRPQDPSLMGLVSVLTP